MTCWRCSMRRRSTSLRASGRCRRRSSETAAPARSLFAEPAAFDAWAVRWRAQLSSQNRDPQAIAAAMDRVKPCLHPAQPPGGRSPGRGDRRRPGTVPTTTRRARPAVRRTTRSGAPTPHRPRRASARTARSAVPEARLEGKSCNIITYIEEWLGTGAAFRACGRLPRRRRRPQWSYRRPHRSRLPCTYGAGGGPRRSTSPARSTDTGPSSLTTMTVAVGSSWL